jgi:hypothetical protein
MYNSLPTAAGITFGKRTIFAKEKRLSIIVTPFSLLSN